MAHARKSKRKGKRRKSVRCTLCTPHRWMGNSKDRFPHRDRRNRKDMD